MKWSRELRIARRSVRTAIKAASAMATARARLPASLRLAPEPIAARATAPPRFRRDDRLRQQSRAADDAGPSSDQTADAGCAADRAAARLRPGRRPASRATRAGSSSRTGWAFPCCCRNSRTRTIMGVASTGSVRCIQARDHGEALSIRQMVAAAVERFASDPGRVFIAGLSAGGAMTAAMLAAYPDVFAGGAVVAGLPVGAAASTSEALRRMAEAGPARSPAAWAEQVRHAAPPGYPGPWPRLSIWYGEADGVVDPANARLLAGAMVRAAWRRSHGAGHAGASRHAARPMECGRTGGRRAVEPARSCPCVAAGGGPRHCRLLGHRGGLTVPQPAARRMTPTAEGCQPCPARPA